MVHSVRKYDTTTKITEKIIKHAEKSDSVVYGTIYQSSRLFDKRPIHSVHFMVQATGIAQIVAGSVAPPQRCRDGATVDTLASLRKQISFEAYFLCVYTLK